MIKNVNVTRMEIILFVVIEKILFAIKKNDQVTVIISTTKSTYVNNGFIWKEYGLLEKISPPSMIISTGKIKNNPNTNGMNE